MNPSSRGFVLSMAVFMMAVFLLLFAQIYSENLYHRQLDKTRQWDQSAAIRIATDLKRDLNLLVDQRLYLIQDSSDVNFLIRGRLPSPLSMQANLLRYQTTLSSWTADQNVYAFLDLNATIADGNVWGTLDNGYHWKEKFNHSRIHFYPTAAIAIPQRIDVNISAESIYTDVNAWSLGSDGNTYVTVQYTDQNTSHDTTLSGWVTLGETKDYTWRYASGQYGITLRIGQLNDTNGSLILDHNGYSSFAVDYAIAFSFDANTTPTRAGYVLPLTTRGNDSNVVESVQWIYE